MKDRFSEYVDRVEREHERVVVTRNGRPAVILISPDDLASLEETIAVLSDTDTVRALPDAVATAVIEFLTGALVENPKRLGRIRGRSLRILRYARL